MKTRNTEGEKAVQGNGSRTFAFSMYRKVSEGIFSMNKSFNDIDWNLPYQLQFSQLRPYRLQVWCHMSH